MAGLGFSKRDEEKKNTHTHTHKVLRQGRPIFFYNLV